MIVFAAVADDDTGATDLAGMLTGEGLRTVLVIDEMRLASWAGGFDAVVIGAATRALPPRKAYDRTRAAVRLLAGLQPRVLEIKYCSTFDSTAEGNIGPSIDAAMDETGEPFTVALPALPVNGRTTYMGHHFVDGLLLSDSPMRHHPLTPMTNSDLVAHLASQTRRRVGLASYPVSRGALERLRASGVEIAILDCIGDADLESVCEAISGLPLITGSSAPAMKLPRLWRERGWYTPREPESAAPGASGSGALIVAGSCSSATAGQNAWWETEGKPVVVLGPAADPGDVARLVSQGRACLVRTPAERSPVPGPAISEAVAAFVRRVFEEAQPSALVVAGGETSGAVTRALELGALAVGRNIEPGVPLCFALGRYKIPVVLKSGNFGSRDFYCRALRACGFNP
jgi:uncharacterized protein YgbK (DUF1537 family)